MLRACPSARDLCSAHFSAKDLCFACIPLPEIYTLITSYLGVTHSYTLFSQVALAPPGTQACTFDIEAFHRTCGVLPDHKAWLVFQGHDGQFYIDHSHPFGASCASSNAGMIANAAVDIWMAEGIKPILKYEDDINVFRYPVENGPFTEGPFTYNYDRSEALHRISSLTIPWHPKKGDPFFASKSTFIGMSWDLDTHHVSLPENKRLKFLRRVEVFVSSFERSKCSLRDVERIHGSLCYISFIYCEGRNRLPSLSNFAASFLGNEYIQRFPPRSLISDLRWWALQLQKTDFHRHLTSSRTPINLGIYVDASTSWGIGIVIQGKWLALKLSPTWKIPGRDICWLETIAVELLVYILEAKGIRESTIVIHSDSQGTIGSMDKGRCPNFHINLAIRRTYSVLCPSLITLSFSYIPSDQNPADPLSRGVLGPPQDKLDCFFTLPEELDDIFINVF